MSSRDKRIVEMRFDNAAFEKGAAQSMSTLQKLKESLDFTKPVKSMQNSFTTITAEITGLGNTVTSFGEQFKTVFLGTLAGQTAYKGIVAGFNFVKKGYDATIGQIISGGKARAQNIESAKFQLGGLGINWDDIYEDLDYAVAGTAYGLDAAAKVGSQFVASGVQLGDDMKAALRGISGVAAMTNSSYEEIGHIFTTVAGQGKLMTMQLNQLAGRGLNVAGTLAEAFGTTEAAVREMVSKGQVDFKTFAEAMNDAFGEHATKANDTFSGSLSNMKAALSRIGALFATPAYDNLRIVINAVTPVINAFKKAITPVADEVTRLMEVGANLAKTLLENFDTSVFNKIMGPVSGLIEMITNSVSSLSDTLTSGTVTKAADALKKFTDAEKQAARDIWVWGKYGDGEVRKKRLKEAGLEYANVQEYLEKYVMTCNEAAYEEALAADNAEELAKTTTEAGKIIRNAKWYSIFRGLGFNEDTTRSIVNVIETIRNAGIVVKNTAESIANVVVAAISGILGYSGYEELTDNIEDISLKMAALSEKFKITKDKAMPITKVFYKITEVVVKTATAIAKFINTLTVAKSDFESVVELGSAASVNTTGGFGTFIKTLGTVAGWFKDLVKWAKEFGSSAKDLDGVKRLAESVKPLGEMFAKLFGAFKVGNDEMEIASAEVGDLSSGFDTMTTILSKAIDWVSNHLAALIEKIPEWAETIKGFFQTIFDGTSLEDKSVIDVIKEVFDSIKGFFSKDKEKNRKQASDWSENVFSGLIDGAKNAIAKLDWKKLEKFSLFTGILVTLFQLNKAVKTVTGTLKSIKDIPTTLIKTFSTVGDFFKSLQKLSSATAIATVALSVAALVMALTFLADVPVDALARAVVYTVLIMESLKSLVKATASLGNITKNVNKSTTSIGSGNSVGTNNKITFIDPIVGMGIMLFGLATAISVVYFAIKGFNKLGTKAVSEGLRQISIIIAEIVGAMVAILGTMKALKTEKISWSIIALIGALAASLAGVILSIAGAGAILSIVSESKLEAISGILASSLLLIDVFIGAIAGVGAAKVTGDQIEMIALAVVAAGGAMVEICAGMALVAVAIGKDELSVDRLNTIGTVLGSLFGAVVAVLTLGGIGLEKAEWVTGEDMQKIAASLDIAAASLIEIAAAISLVAVSGGFAGLDTNTLNAISGNIAALFGMVAFVMSIMGFFAGIDSEKLNSETYIQLGTAMAAGCAGLIIVAAAVSLLAATIGNVSTGKLIGMSAMITIMLGAITAMFAGFAVLMHDQEIESDELIKMAASIAIMAGVFAALAVAIALISKIKFDFWNAAKILLLAGVSLLGLALLGSRLGGGLETVAKSLILIAGAGLIFAAGTWVFAKALDALGEALPKFADGLSLFVEKLIDYKPALIAVIIAIVAIAAVLALAIAAAVKFGPAIETAFATFANIASMVVEWFSNLEDDTKKGIAAIMLGIGAALVTATPGLLKAFGEIIIKVMTFLGILIGPIANALLIFIIETINAVADAVRSNSGPLLAAIMNLLSAVMVLVSYAVKLVIAPLVNLIDYLLEDLLLGAEGSLWMALYALLIPFEEFGKGILKIVAKAIDAVVWLTEDDFIWGNILGTYKKGDEARKNVESWLDSTTESFEKKMNNLENRVFNRASIPYETIMDDLANIDKIMSGERQSAWLSDFDAGFDDFNQKVTDWGKSAVELYNVSYSIGDAYKQLGESIAVAEKSLKEAETAEEKANYAQMAASFRNRQAVLQKEAEEEAEEGGSNIIGGLFSGMIKGFSANEGLKSMASDKLSGEMTKMFGDSMANVDFNGLIDSVTSGEVDPENITALAQATGITEDQAAGLQDMMKQFGMDNIDAFADGMIESQSEAEEAAEDVTDGASDVLEEAGDDAEEAGKFFVGGFARGIWANRNSVMEKVQMVADYAVAQLRRSLDEHSPSRVTEELGKFFTLGFANGVEGYSNVAVEKTASMAERTTDAFRSSLQTISDAISTDVEANPTIRPVMDLSNVRDSVGSINSMFSSQSARYAAINNRLSNETAAYRFELDQSSRYDNSDVVSAIGGMQEEMTGLKDAMMDTQIVMDSGVLVGQLAPGMDRTLGRMSTRKSRRN